MLATWQNLFDGYNVLGDVWTKHPNLYLDAANSGSAFQMYDQMIQDLPNYVWFVVNTFFNSTFLIVLIASSMFVLFIPIIRRPQRW